MDPEFAQVAPPRDLRAGHLRGCNVPTAAATVTLNKEIQRGLRGDASPSPLARRVAEAAREAEAEAYTSCADPQDVRDALRQLLCVLDRAASPILDEDQTVLALGRIAAHCVRWV